MRDAEGSIAVHYKIDAAKPVRTVGGLRAYAVIDGRDPARALLAIRARPDLPPRPIVIANRSAGPIPHAVMPLDCGIGRDLAGEPAYFMICAALPTLALGAELRPWTEAEIIRCLLLPAAAALEALQARGITHRAIRPDNLFRTKPGEAVTLGPCWAAPPGSLQQAVFEPTYSAWCAPAARGEGAIADDVYALAVTMLTLVLGRVPLAELGDEAVTLSKLDLGSFAALTAGAAIPAMIADLARSMLAEDPEHRPSPTHLLDPIQARTRRVAARPPRRAQRPLTLGPREAWTARDLAYALGTHPDDAALALRNGAVDRWLRRSLGDAQLAVRLDDTMQRRNQEQDADDGRQQQQQVMKAVAVLDPLAPLTWRGIAFWPDGLGAYYASLQPVTSGSAPRTPAEDAAIKRQRVMLEEAVTEELTCQWLACRGKHQDAAALAEAPRAWRTWLLLRGPSGGGRRLLYELNPLLPCGSPLLGGDIVTRPVELLTALDEAAAKADRKQPPIDSFIAAFLAARSDNAVQADLSAIQHFASRADLMAVLALFARLQTRLYPQPLLGLAAWLLACGLNDLTVWRSTKTRSTMEARLAVLAGAGQLDPIVQLLQDETGLQMDREGAARAGQRIQEISKQLSELTLGASERGSAAHLLGLDIATGAGLVAILGAAVTLVLAGG